MTTREQEAEYFVKTYELGGFDALELAGEAGPMRVKRIEARGALVCITPEHGEALEVLPDAILRPVKSVPPLVH